MLHQAGADTAKESFVELSARFATGDLDAVVPTFAAAIERGPLPDLDASLLTEMQAMQQRVETRIDTDVRSEVIERSAALDLDDLFDALDVAAAAAPAR